MSPRGAPRGSEFKALLVGVHRPLNRDIPSLRDAKSFEDAHGGRGNSPDAFFSTIWLTASCSANRFSRCFCCVTSRSRQRTANGLPAFTGASAQAEFQLQHAPVCRVMTQRSPFYHLAIQRAPEQRGHLPHPNPSREEIFRMTSDLTNAV